MSTQIILGQTKEEVFELMAMKYHWKRNAFILPDASKVTLKKFVSWQNLTIAFDSKYAQVKIAQAFGVLF
jgi:hypothetical protein